MNLYHLQSTTAGQCLGTGCRSPHPRWSEPVMARGPHFFLRPFTMRRRVSAQAAPTPSPTSPLQHEDRTMRGVIRLNDPTSHGGRVISASGHHLVMGLGVARLGDSCSCPVKGHGRCVISEGDPAVLVDGRPVAFDGHKTSCGAVLLSTAPDHGRG